jgi:hypothetical protein
MAKKPLLKDQLFNQAKVKQIADEIQRVYPQFDKNSFAERIAERFPHLELKERIAWISENLHAFCLLTTEKRLLFCLLLCRHQMTTQERTMILEILFTLLMLNLWPGTA